eukprot:TRINITY_DN2849_c0_g1_i2.p1 TRINITY_DN2849_c0_g1~~TRINITY_DN2849_c0_g1_i2.p1  ORF type:complete len:1148 (+),score=373.83 TRINITY_DN2849_c0_g1_i2:166-3609(+)
MSEFTPPPGVKAPSTGGPIGIKLKFRQPSKRTLRIETPQTSDRSVEKVESPKAVVEHLNEPAVIVDNQPKAIIEPVDESELIAKPTTKVVVHMPTNSEPTTPTSIQHNENETATPERLEPVLPSARSITQNSIGQQTIRVELEETKNNMSLISSVQMSELGDSSSEWESSSDEYDSEYDETESEVEDNGDSNVLKRENQKLNTMVTEMRGSIQQLQQKIGKQRMKLKERKQEIDHQRYYVDDVETDRDKLTVEVASLRKEMDLLRQRQNSVEEKLVEEREEFDVLCKEAEQATGALGTRNDELAQERIKVSTLEEELSSVKKSLRRLRKESEKWNPPMEDACLSARSYKEHVQVVVRDGLLETKDEMLGMNDKSLAKVKDQLQKMTKEMDRLKDHLTTKQKDCHKRDKVIQKLKKEVEKWQKVSDQSKGKEKAFQIANEQNSKLLAVLKNQEKVMKGLSEERDNWKSEAEMLKYAADDAHRRASEHEAELTIEKSQRIAFEERLNGIDERNEREKDKLKAEIKELQITNQVKLASLEEEGRVRREDHYNVLERLSETERARVRASDEVERRGDQVTRMQERMLQLDAELLQKERFRQAEVNMRDEAIKGLQKEIETFKAVEVESEKEIERINSNNRELTSNIMGMVAQHKSDQDRVAELQEEISAREERCVFIETQMRLEGDRYNAEITGLKGELELALRPSIGGLDPGHSDPRQQVAKLSKLLQSNQQNLETVRMESTAAVEIAEKEKNEMAVENTQIKENAFLQREARMICLKRVCEMQLMAPPVLLERLPTLADESDPWRRFEWLRKQPLEGETRSCLVLDLRNLGIQEEDFAELLSFSLSKTLEIGESWRIDENGSEESDENKSNNEEGPCLCVIASGCGFGDVAMTDVVSFFRRFEEADDKSIKTLRVLDLKDNYISKPWVAKLCKSLETCTPLGVEHSYCNAEDLIDGLAKNGATSFCLNVGLQSPDDYTSNSNAATLTLTQGNIFHNRANNNSNIPPDTPNSVASGNTLRNPFKETKAAKKLRLFETTRETSKIPPKNNNNNNSKNSMRRKRSSRSKKGGMGGNRNKPYSSTSTNNNNVSNKRLQQAYAPVSSPVTGGPQSMLSATVGRNASVFKLNEIPIMKNSSSLPLIPNNKRGISR